MQLDYIVDFGEDGGRHVLVDTEGNQHEFWEHVSVQIDGKRGYISGLHRGMEIELSTDHSKVELDALVEAKDWPAVAAFAERAKQPTDGKVVSIVARTA